MNGTTPRSARRRPATDPLGTNAPIAPLLPLAVAITHPLPPASETPNPAAPAAKNAMTVRRVLFAIEPMVTAPGTYRGAYVYHPAFAHPAQPVPDGPN